MRTVSVFRLCISFSGLQLLSAAIISSFFGGATYANFLLVIPSNQQKPLATGLGMHMFSLGPLSRWSVTAL